MTVVVVTLMLALAQTAPGVEATGGTFTETNGYCIHTFTTAGTTSLNVTVGGNVDVLVVAGGGGGGNSLGGGGGAGGLIYTGSYAVTSGSITVTVGAGGAGGLAAVNGGGFNGTNSEFGALTAYGGGGGAGWSSTPPKSGGSGGGAYAGGTGALGTNGQGNAGGNGGPTGVKYPAGGGGGAGAAGGNGVEPASGDGGIGLQYSISGAATYYAGGGGGGSYLSGPSGTGGDGGGGNGGVVGGNNPGSPGQANTGGGGGAGAYATGYAAGGAGGSGIVIVRYMSTTPFIENSPATNVTATSAWLNGTLTSTGAAPTTVFVYWGATDATTNKAAWAYTNDFGQSAIGGLTTNVTGLSSNTTYYYRFYATNSYGDCWAGSSESFKTHGLPGVNNGDGATAVGFTAATLNGNLTNGGSAYVYIYWGTETNDWANTNDLGTLNEGSFSTNIAGLTTNTTYYYRCYVTNTYGEDWADSATNFITATDTGEYYVTPEGGGAFDGSSWENAFSNIQDAVDVASDTVWVTNGTYAVMSQIVVTNGITVKSVNGKDVTAVTRGDTNQYRIFLVSNATAVVDGFTVSNGYGRADVSLGHSYGGGIRLDDGTVRNCRIVWNTCMGGQPGEVGRYGYGGGVYMATGRVENCEILNNAALGAGSAQGYGGGIQNVNGAIISCVITGNYTRGTGNGGSFGGGVGISGIGTMTDSTVAGNWAEHVSNGPYSYGGGIYLSGAGMVSNCVVTENYTDGNLPPGGGIYMSAGLVTHCRILSNRCTRGSLYSITYYSQGGGVYISGGTLRNCVIAQNRVQYDYPIGPARTRGAGISIAGGRVEQCTVSRNSVEDAYGRGDGIYMTAGELWNSIVYYNFDDSVTNYTADHENVWQEGGTFNYSCTPNFQGLSGVSNVFADPGFAYRWTNDFRLLPGSPCLDTGTNLTDVTTDIAGNPRPRDGDGDASAGYDMGAYEAAPVTSGSFRVNFATVPEEAVGSADVVLTAYAAGTNTSALTFTWDFTDDGSSDAYDAVVTNFYGAPEYYTVKLIVSNSVAESDTVIKQAAVRIFPPVVYVATNGSHDFPFDTWAKASTNLQPAIDAAFPGTTVTLGSGAFAVSAPVSVRRGVFVAGSDGPINTAVERESGENTRIFVVSHPDAVVDGLTIRNGSWASGWLPYGGGVWMTAGMLRNCIISNNFARGLPNQPGYGGGVYMEGGTLRNCLIFTNKVESQNSVGYGGGVYISGGMVQSCTIVTNSAQHKGGGVYSTAGSFTNTIVYFNTTNGLPNNYSGGTFAYSCTTPDPGGTGNITNEPIFVATTDADYHLASGSPCINTGTNQAWMIGAFDLDGNPRVVGKVDIGAYEWQPPGGTLMLIR